MDRFKLDEIPKKTRAELTAELEELKADLKKLKEERPLPGAKVTDGAPNKLSGKCPLSSLSLARLSEMSKKHKAALREEYKNREPLILDLRRKSPEDPCCTAASPPGFLEAQRDP